MRSARTKRWPRKSWTDKINDTRPHQVKPAPIAIAGMKAGQVMLVPSARQVDVFIRTIPAGQCIDIPTLRRKPAKLHRAGDACQGLPLDAVTPFWRVLDLAARRLRGFPAARPS